MNLIKKNMIASLVIFIISLSVFLFSLTDIETNWIGLAFSIPFMAGMIVYFWYLIKEKRKLHDESIRRKMK